LTPPNISSDAPDANAEAGVGTGNGNGTTALVARLAGELGADRDTLAAVAALHAQAQTQAPDIFVPVSRGIGAALAALAADPAGDTQKLLEALGEWALDAEREPLERMRGDCQRFQAALTRAALRIHAADGARGADTLLALQRYTLLQVALLAALAARSPAEGGVVRTLPTPEYAAFMDIFRTTIEAHRADGKQLGLLVLQIPKIEQVDRLLGMQKGEAFMLRVTRRLHEGVLRKNDRLGRISRDQFACLLPRIAGEGVAILAASKILDALEMPVPIGDHSFDTDAVIGIALYPDHGDNPQMLVRNAKLAAAAARERAEHFAVYDALHGENVERTLQVETRLRNALEQNTLGLAFTPQLDLASRRIAALGVGLQWPDTEPGAMAEIDAIEAAETAGLIREVTWWLYNNAFRQCVEFAGDGIALPIALQLSAGGLAQPDIVEFIDRALRTWKIAPQQVTVEVHESALAEVNASLKDTLGGLKALGVQLGIDGFGTASVSLANLAELPFDEVRIGGALLGNNVGGALNVKVVRALAHLAQDFGFALTADGVNNADTALALSTLGCKRIQGPHVGRALSAAEVLSCLRNTDPPAQLPLMP
jgi:diguanylate cyclase (GGDEF)-like protein